MDHFLLQAEWLKHLRALSYPAGATPCKAAANGEAGQRQMAKKAWLFAGQCGRWAPG
jgi:hypothetical protein